MEEEHLGTVDDVDLDTGDVLHLEDVDDIVVGGLPICSGEVECRSNKEWIFAATWAHCNCIAKTKKERGIGTNPDASLTAGRCTRTRWLRTAASGPLRPRLCIPAAPAEHRRGRKKR